MTNKLVKCSKCKQGIFYIPSGYTMGVKVECVNCHSNQPVKRTKQTLSASYSKMKKGIRIDIHHSYSFKSATEANFARILNFLKLDWKYEERAFTFGGYKRRPHVYIMDFEILESSPPLPEEFKFCNLTPGFYEIKGYMKPESREKLRRLKRHYLDEFEKTKVVLYNKYKKQDIEFCTKVGYHHLFYDELTKIFRPFIPTWE